MKKVMVITNSLNGLYSFRRELIDQLLFEKHEVYIVAPQDIKSAYFIEKGCYFIETPVSRRGTNPITDLKLMNKYFKILKKNKPDTVLTYTIKPNIYGGIAARILKIPYIANITGLGTVVENKSLLQFITITLYKVALKKVQIVFFQNEENKSFFEKEKISSDKHRLIPGSGVNLDYFQLLEYPRGNKIEFLFIARIMKEKGIDQYLEAAKFIKSKYPDTVFHILGTCEESYTKKLKEMDEKNIIRYHGRQDDVRKFHQYSHCTIHPTYYPEGMSNVLLESAACGRPIITTDRAGCREIVEDGINGFIIKQKNSLDLIEKIEHFINLDRFSKEKMGLNGRAKVELEFSRNLVVNAYLEEINKEGK